jgi:hypothetical protein
MSKISRLLNLDYRVERTILSGKNVRPKSQQPSVLYFTIHKAASFYVNRIMRKLMKAGRYIPANLEGYSFQHQSSVIQVQPNHIQPIGLYYGALRRPIKLEPNRQLKVIVQVRDPRDAITSSYFSFAKSHKAPVHEDRKAVFEQSRARIADSTIDDYVLQASKPVANKLRQYTQDLFPRDQVLVLHYEDMVLDFEGWFESLLNFVDLPDSRQLQKSIDQVRKEANFDVNGENKGQHKRQVVPGDHLRKLHPKTIATINQTFAGYFQALTDSGQLSSNYTFPGTQSKAA